MKQKCITLEFAQDCIQFGVFDLIRKGLVNAEITKEGEHDGLKLTYKKPVAAIQKGGFAEKVAEEYEVYFFIPTQNLLGILEYAFQIVALTSKIS